MIRQIPVLPYGFCFPSFIPDGIFETILLWHENQCLNFRKPTFQRLKHNVYTNFRIEVVRTNKN